MTTTNPTTLVGISLPAYLAEMIDVIYYRPRYLGLQHSLNNVQQLCEALRSPAQAQLASMSIEQHPDLECFAVPFDDLRKEARFTLDGFYLFEADIIDLFPGRERVRCLVTPFEEQVPDPGQEETQLKLPMRLSPPWEMLPPSYIGCREVPSRISRLNTALQDPQLYLTLSVLQAEELPEQARRYRMAALSAARPETRALLLEMDPSIFHVFYRQTLRNHPLLKPYGRALQPAELGE